MQGGNLVKGYKQWEKEFDRHVSPEKKLSRYLRRPRLPLRNKWKKSTRTPKSLFSIRTGNLLPRKRKSNPRLSCGICFDVSQTEGKELPDLGIKELTGDVEQYQDFFAALEKTSPFAMGFEALSGSIKDAAIMRKSVSSSTRAWTNCRISRPQSMKSPTPRYMIPPLPCRNARPPHPRGTGGKRRLCSLPTLRA